MKVPQENEVIVGRDYAGRKLCKACWDGAHYYRWEVRNEIGKGKHTVQVVVTDKTFRNKDVFSNCMQGQCECDCVELKKEKRKRVKRDHSQQITIAEVGGTIDV